LIYLIKRHQQRQHTEGVPFVIPAWANAGSRCVRLSPHIIGWIPQMVAWGLVIARFAKADSDTDHQMPEFVKVIIGLELFLFASFGVVQFVFLWNTITPNRAVVAEAAYCVLSAVAKVLLAWMVFVNVLL
jgi:hypothetical protein